MSRPVPLVVGVVALAGWIVGVFIAGKAALLGWLVAFLAFSSVPIGCLAVLIMLTLVPGKWRELYTAPFLLGSALLPIAALAVIPILLGMATLYAWTDPSVTAGYPAFKAAWLSPGFFVVRQIVYWIVLIGLWWALLVLPSVRPVIAGGGLIAYAIFSSWMGVDLTESVRPDFHSSIWGLLILANQWMAAMGFGILVGLLLRAEPPPIAAAGAFTVALLAWAYLHAMQFIVIWSGDIPAEVRWYLDRGLGGWAFASAALYLLQGFGPFFALLSPAVRNSRGAMMGIAALTLAMRPVEAAWLILPGQHAGWAVLPLALLALLAMAGLGAAAVGWVRRRRPDWVGGSNWWAAETRSA